MFCRECISTYVNLYNIVGNTYGAGNGSTTFNVPDLRRKMVLGFGTTASGTAVGVTGGSFDHTHSGPSHTHDMSNHTHSMQDHTHGMNHSHSLTFFLPDVNTSIGGYYTNIEANRTVLENVTFSNVPANFTVNRSFAEVSSFNHFHPVAPSNSSSPGFSGQANEYTGSTGSPSSANTGAPSNNTTGASGTDQTGGSNPPYMTLQYIIKT
jgi:microcystin-dependent protein